MEISIIVTSPVSVIPPAWATLGSSQSVFTPEAPMVGRVGSREQTDLHFIDWTKQRLRAGSALSKVTRGIGRPTWNRGLLLCQVEGLAVSVSGFACRFPTQLRPQ